MSQVQPVYVISGARTPCGKKGEALSRVHPAKLGAIVGKEAIKRAGLTPKDIDETIDGCATQTAEQGFNLSRTKSVSAFGPDIPASSVNMLCGSSAQAVRLATALLESGENEIMLAGGIENNSMVPMGGDLAPAIGQTLSEVVSKAWRTIKLGPKIIKDSLPEDYEFYAMGKSGDALAEKRGYTLEDLSGVAFRSQMNAANAMYSGYFAREIVTVQTPKGYLSHDETVRANTSLKQIASQKPSFGGLHSAATSSPAGTVCAAALVLANEEAVKKHNLQPMAKIVASAVVGVDPFKPEDQLIGPPLAIKKVLEKTGLTVNDIDLFEINEAFAAVVLATIEDMKIPVEKVNVNGGAIALGHALGASGARLPVTLLHELERRAELGLPSKRGLSTLCIGGGQAIATIFERV